MRDKERIDKILGLIGKTWKKHPDMRFYQLLINIGMIPDDNKLWRIEDDVTEKHLKKVKL